MMFAKNKAIIALFALALLLGGGYAIYQATTTNAAELTEAPLQTAIVRQGNITISAIAAGSVIAAHSVDLTFSANGTVAELLAQVGDTVQAGDILARLDDTDAQKTLAQAQLQYAQTAMQTDPGATEIGVSYNEISVAQAQLNLADAQNALDKLQAWQPDPDEIALLELRLTAAQINYETAQASNNSGNIANAQVNLFGAEQALANALAGPAENQLAAAETAVAKAELALQQTWLNLQSQSLSLRQAQLNLTAAEAALNKTILVAPIDGTIIAINKRVGEQTGSGLFLTLADLSQPMLEIFLDETDLGQAAVGNVVEVVFDAFPEETFAGRIVQVDPKLHQASGGISAVRALATLNRAPAHLLPIGLNATVEVIGGRAANALLVPVEALREITPGQYSLFVLENGEPRLRLVEVGLMDFSFAQILSGVSAGEQVTTGIVRTE